MKGTATPPPRRCIHGTHWCFAWLPRFLLKCCGCRLVSPAKGKPNAILNQGKAPGFLSHVFKKNKFSIVSLTKVHVLHRYSLSRTKCKSTCRDAVHKALFKGRKETAGTPKHLFTAINGSKNLLHWTPPAALPDRSSRCRYWRRTLLHRHVTDVSGQLSLVIIQKRWEAC